MKYCRSEIAILETSSFPFQVTIWKPGDKQYARNEFTHLGWAKVYVKLWSFFGNRSYSFHNRKAIRKETRITRARRKGLQDFAGKAIEHTGGIF